MLSELDRPKPAIVNVDGLLLPGNAPLPVPQSPLPDYPRGKPAPESGWEGAAENGSTKESAERGRRCRAEMDVFAGYKPVTARREWEIGVVKEKLANNETRLSEAKIQIAELQSEVASSGTKLVETEHTLSSLRETNLAVIKRLKEGEIKSKAVSDELAQSYAELETIKAALSGILIAVISEVSKRCPGLGALIASLPLISVLGMVWLWRDKPDVANMAAVLSLLPPFLRS